MFKLKPARTGKTRPSSKIRSKAARSRIAGHQQTRANSKQEQRTQGFDRNQDREGFAMSAQALPLGQSASKTVFFVLWAASFCHLLNDMMQALLPAVYPTFREVLTSRLLKSVS
jgi:hypothetical protein